VNISCPVCGSRKVQLASEEAIRGPCITLRKPRQCESCGCVFEPRASSLRAVTLLAFGLLLVALATYEAINDILHRPLHLSTVVAVLAVAGGGGFIVTGVRYWRLRGHPIIHHVDIDRHQ
jgi:hypothetical protein